MPEYICNKIQMQQNTNGTKYKLNKIQNSKIQTQQNTKEQNTNCQNTNVTKYKCNQIQRDKIQIEQNAKIPKYNHHIVDLLP